MQQRSWLVEAMPASRSRQSWNERLEHWEKPATDSEEATIERAAAIVRTIMAGRNWFLGEGCKIEPQGSYFNNTNVRQEADIDLRAVHPMLKIEYGPGVAPGHAYNALGYTDVGKTFSAVATKMRSEIASGLMGRFGAENVDTGTKAVTLKKLAGSRAAVDVVPCFGLHYITLDAFGQSYLRMQGVAILDANDRFIFNFPDQHHDNGIAKRARTQLRFKKNVRMLKNLRNELVDGRVIDASDAPSFLVECLVYGVDDGVFLLSEDRYDRLSRIVAWIHTQLDNQLWCNTAKEINGVKSLFGSHQPWSVEGARRFTAAAWNRLMA